MRSFQSNENIHKKEGGSYYVVSAIKASSVTARRTWVDVGSVACGKSVRKHTHAMLWSHAFSGYICFQRWPQDNVKPYVYPTGSVRCPFGYSTGLCGCRTDLELFNDQSCGVVRTCTGKQGLEETQDLRAPTWNSWLVYRPHEGRNPNRTARHAVRGLTIFRVARSWKLSIHNSDTGFLRVEDRRQAYGARRDRLVYGLRTGSHGPRMAFKMILHTSYEHSSQIERLCHYACFVVLTLQLLRNFIPIFGFDALKQT